ncbi:ABC transporter ATP-binding protein [Urechidicola croceus]|uniref:ABC transporter ATP-binding protein n=1 Tax=Urechidicola croceus TaxID=1850246 RepID=A0A1D8P4I5_9FLAO|nr:ABC transporter ATP-binding protein [Urechidicola croceus]AOW19421.1 ABC transporter ATP-binding protein [Urechidicola croceus]
MNQEKKHIILRTRNLDIGYLAKKNKTFIAEKLNITLSKGQFACLLGKNGIGKSTLLRTLTKVQSKLSGEIFVNSMNIESLSPNELARTMSLVLTEKLPESNLTVFELIALGRQPYTNWIGNLSQNDIEKINNSLKLTHIEHLTNKKFYELSDGQLQRVLISRALAQDTDIIILDEPTAHLDVLHKMETFQLLKRLAVELGKTIIVSTHEIHLAIESANELWLMTENDFITGNPRELIQNGSIQKLFSSDIVEFDSIKEKFVLKNSVKK